MTEASVKNSLRSFGSNVKLNNKLLDPVDASNVSIQLTRIGKMLDESVLKFTKRYLIIQTELEEMKREFVGNVSLVNEYLNLTKKEIRAEKYDNIIQGKIYGNPLNIPKLPNYEQKALLKDKKNNKSAYLNYKKTNLNNSNNIKKGNSNVKKAKNQEIEKKIPSIFKDKSPYKNNMKNKMDPEIQNLNNSNYYTHQSGNYDNDENELSQNKITNKNLKTSSLNDKKKMEIIESLPDNKSKAIYILLNSPIVPYDDKLKLLPSNKAICSLITSNDIFNNELANIENKINLLKQQPIEEDEKVIIDKLSNYPSKTAKTGLNFLTNEKENELFIENEQNQKLLEMTYGCLGEDINENLNINEAYNYLFKKYNVDSIKNLYFDHIYKKVYNDTLNGNVDQNEIENIINCIEENKMLITDVLVSNANKTFSYVAFSLDEIYEYLKGVKDLDEDLKEKLSNELELKLLIEEEEKIRNMIK